MTGLEKIGAVIAVWAIACWVVCRVWARAFNPHRRRVKAAARLEQEAIDRAALILWRTSK